MAVLRRALSEHDMRLAAATGDACRGRGGGGGGSGGRRRCNGLAEWVDVEARVSLGLALLARAQPPEELPTSSTRPLQRASTLADHEALRSDEKSKEPLRSLGVQFKGMSLQVG